MPELRSVLNHANLDHLIQIAKFIGFNGGKEKEIRKKYLNKKEYLIKDIDRSIRWHGKAPHEKLKLPKFKRDHISYPYINILKKELDVLKINHKDLPTVKECEEKLCDYILNKLPEDEVKKLPNNIEPEILNILEERGKKIDSRLLVSLNNPEIAKIVYNMEKEAIPPEPEVLDIPLLLYSYFSERYTKLFPATLLVAQLRVLQELGIEDLKK